MTHLAHVTRVVAHVARLGAGAAPSTGLAVTPTLHSHDNSVFALNY